jgi:hypothetical protein
VVTGKESSAAGKALAPPTTLTRRSSGLGKTDEETFSFDF